MTTYLFIDGTNFYAGQYEFFGPNKYLDFSLFIKQVEKKLNIVFDKILFYASYTPKKKRLTKKEYEFISNEFSFYRSVKKTPRVTFFKGYRSKTSGKEKEVDVKLSVDLVGYGLLGKFDSAYLITGDADFLQAVQFLKRHKPSVKIRLICLANKIMYRGLYAIPSYIIDHQEKKTLFDKKLIKRNKIVFIKFNELLKKI